MIRHNGGVLKIIFSRFGNVIVLLVGLLFLIAGPATAQQHGTGNKARIDIPVPVTVIYPGQIVAPSMLGRRNVPVEYTGRVAVFVSVEGLLGKVARTTLLPRRPILTHQVAEPDVVMINRPAMMVFVSGGLKISAEVVPLNSAKAGEIVRVRNRQSGAIITGIAMADGRIKAGLK